jgi:hypothetical protein
MTEATRPGVRVQAHSARCKDSAAFASVEFDVRLPNGEYMAGCAALVRVLGNWEVASLLDDHSAARLVEIDLSPDQRRNVLGALEQACQAEAALTLGDP